MTEIFISALFPFFISLFISLQFPLKRVRTVFLTVLSLGFENIAFSNIFLSTASSIICNNGADMLFFVLFFVLFLELFSGENKRFKAAVL